MSEGKSWTDHVTNGEAWFRFLLMILFTPFLGCAAFLILSIALFQFVSVLVTGESNQQFRELGRDLSGFSAGIVEFLTYNTERRPFPFTSSQSAEGAENISPASEAPNPRQRGSATRKKTATRKRYAPPRKKTTGRTTKSVAEARSGPPAEQTESDDASNGKHTE